MKKRRVERWQLGLGALLFVLFILSALLRQPNTNSESPSVRMSDGTPTGGKGLALTLQRLGYTTRVQNAPLDAMPADATAWLILDPHTTFSTRESKALLAWVNQGGTLIFCVPETEMPLFSAAPAVAGTGINTLRNELGVQSNSNWNGNASSKDGFFPDLSPLRFDPAAPERAGVRQALAVPGTVNLSKSNLAISSSGSASMSLLRVERGKGRVYLLPDAWLFTNYGLTKPDNAVLATNLIRLHAKSGAVVWDERQHGDDLRPPEPDSIQARLRQAPYIYAIWQLLAAGLLFWAFTGRRLGTAVPLPQRGPVTRASQFATAMGGLFQKIGRPGAASQIVSDTFRRRLAVRLGLSPADPDAVLAQRAQEVAGVPFEVVDRLLLQGRTPNKSEAQALHDAQEMEMVLRKLESS